MQKNITTHSEKETTVLGERLARCLKKGLLLCLFGELGSGKTTLTKGIAQGLGLNKKEIISPSFVLIREHKLKKINFYHLDLYRLNKMNELLNLGYEDYLYPDGITVIEWADRIENFLPDEYLRIELKHHKQNQRKIGFRPKGKKYLSIIKKFYADFRN